MKTLIFGAGASIPFFEPKLSTKYLTDKIIDRQEWDKVIAIVKSIKGEDYIIAKTEIVLQIIQTIQKIKPNANFEEIAEVIDKLSSFGFDMIPEHNMFNVVIHVMNTGFDPRVKKPFGCEWAMIPFLLREIIAMSIIELQNNHKIMDYDNLISLQKDFINSICEKDDDVSIMSLNYDECVLKSLEGLGFEKGFKTKNEHYLMQLDTPTFMSAKKVVYFPHGNLRFQFTDNDNITYWSDANDAEAERWKGISSSSLGSTLTCSNGKFVYNYNTFISTGQTKDDGLNHLPYAVYYQRLGIDINKSDSIYIIGYSFGDDHINRLLRSFIEISPENKIYVIDYYPKEVAGTDEYKDQNNIITKLYFTFGAEWGVVYNRDTNETEPLNPEEIKKINSLGYGEIFKQVILYKKGFSEFLHEFNNVI